MRNRYTKNIALSLLACLLAVSVAIPQALKPARTRQRVHHPASLQPSSAAQRLQLSKVDTVFLPFLDNMENPGLWTSTGMWQWAFQPQRVSVLRPDIFPALVVYPDSGVLPSANSGDGAWWFGENATGTFIGSDFDRAAQTPLGGGFSKEVIQGELTSPPISLVGRKNGLLTFWTWWEIEGVDADAFDEMFVEVSSDAGVNWQPAGRGELNPLNDANGESWKPFSSGGIGARGQWTQQFFDLTNYVGSVIRLRFRFDSGDESYNGFRGWLIDDLAILDATVPRPVITQVFPRLVNPGQVVTMTGLNFMNGAVFQLDNVPLPRDSATVLSSTTATLLAPSTLGTYDIRIINPDGKDTSSVRAFTVTTALAPIITSIVPDSAALGASVPLTIRGNHFKVEAVVGIVSSVGAASLTNIQLTDSTVITGDSPPNLPAGTYNVLVLNTDGLYDQLILGFKVFSPQIKIAVPGDSLIGNPQPIKITPPGGTAFTSGVLFYRIGGQSSYSQLTLLRDTSGFQINIPAALLTIRGLDYWIRLTDTATGFSMTYPLNSPAQNPASFPIRISSVRSPLSLTALRYKMISTPVLLDLPSLGLQLVDDFGVYNQTNWRIFRWEDAVYKEGSQISAPLAPGYGFWLVTSNGASYDFKRGTSVTAAPYYVPLDTGWNQIGDPFAFPVSWSTVTIANGVAGPYAYDGVQYRIVSYLFPFEGYFVYNGNLSSTPLIFAPVEAINPINKADATASHLASGEFVVQFAARIPGTDYQDSFNYVGLRNLAAVGRDGLDAPKPPSIGDGIEVRILDQGTAWLQNFKPAGDEGRSWIIAVTSRGNQGKAIITLTTQGTLPQGYEMHVLNLNEENVIPSGPVELDMTGVNDTRQFKVILGTAAFAAQESKGIPLQPVAFALQQNYPNPFNPETRIRYALARRSDVSLEVYNTLGQRVRTLFNGSQTTGEYEVVWNGTNESGGQAASGVYFYRLRTEGFTAVRKLVLVR